MEEIKSYFRGIDRKGAVVALLSTVLMFLYLYPGSHTFFSSHYLTTSGWLPQLYQIGCSLIFLFLIPLLTIKIILKENAGSFGLKTGDSKFGLRFVCISVIILIPVLYLNSKDKAFMAEYPLVKEAGLTPVHYLAWEASYFLFYIGWEFFFRGFMLYGLLGALGPFYSIMVETMASTIMHIGKPAGETFAAIPGGIIFGAVALRTRSIIWVLIVHFFLGALTDLFSLYHSGSLWP